MRKRSSYAGLAVRRTASLRSPMTRVSMWPPRFMDCRVEPGNDDEKIERSVGRFRRRDFIALLGGFAAFAPLAAPAQQPAMRVVGFPSGRSLATDKHLVVAFRQGLSESGYVEGWDVMIDYSWAEGQLDRLPGLAADLVRRQVSVIFAGGMDVKIRAVKDAISTIPVVLATGGDPVELGLVGSMNRPGANATAVTVVTAVLSSKRLELLHKLLPSVTLVALLL